MLFATEIVFRLIAVGPKAFIRSRWNVFDTTVVSGSLLGYFYKSAEGLSIFRTLRLVGGQINLSLEFDFEPFSISVFVSRFHMITKVESESVLVSVFIEIHCGICLHSLKLLQVETHKRALESRLRNMTRQVLIQEFLKLRDGKTQTKIIYVDEANMKQ